jgi:BirA family transcriptional regulator, biotin operon repressor / biotin---[acetyl-CoA-carboxylase] ligase
MDEASSRLSEGLDVAVARGLLDSGCARRTALMSELGRSTWSAEARQRVVVSGQVLASQLGLSRAAVHKHVARLRGLGFAVEAVTGSGYCLAAAADDLLASEAVLPFLLDVALNDFAWLAGLPYYYIPACGSTNQLLKEAASGLPAGATMVTDAQSAGRGRLDRCWTSAAGKDLTFSVLLRPRLSPAEAHLLSLAAALAVAEEIESLPGLRGRVGIKWPNDVLIDEKKVCGILVEGSMQADRVEWAVAGIGLNVNSDPAALKQSLGSLAEAQWLGKPEPTSLRASIGREIPRAPLLGSLLRRLTFRCGDARAADTLEGLRRRDLLIGKRVAIIAGSSGLEPFLEGEAMGVGAEGELLVRDARGETVAVFAGDVTLRRS